MDYKTFVFFDNEFVCTQNGCYPIQVSFEAKECKSKKFKDIGLFNKFIKPRSPKVITKYFIRYTGITYDYLKEHGLPRKEVKKATIEYFKSFDLDTTLFIGWDIYNDLESFNVLTKSLRFKLKKVNFLDLSPIYQKLRKDKNRTKLALACSTYDLQSKDWHDASVDAHMTYLLFTKINEEIGLNKIIKGNVFNYKK